MKKIPTSQRAATTPIRRGVKRPRLFVESLEDRRMLAILTVTTDLDIVDATDAQTSLREAISSANELPGVDEIVFDLGHDRPALIRLEHGEIEISDSIVIDGNKPELLTIDAQQRSRIFHASQNAGDVVIQGVTLTGGRTTGQNEHGGAIYSRSGGWLTIANSVVSNNQTTHQDSATGGGVYSAGPMRVEDSTIESNTSSTKGGGIYVHGPIDVHRSLLAYNTAEGGGGGGIYAQQGATIYSSAFVGNESRAGGGMDVWRGVLLVESSTFSGNVGHEGSALNSRGHETTIRFSTIVGNRVNAGTAVNTIGGASVLEIVSSIVALNRGSTTPDFDRSYQGHVDVRNSLIGDNRGTTLSEAPFGSPDANGNIIGGPIHGLIDPRLAALSDNGGGSLTHALLSDSPAINAGNPLATTSELAEHGVPLFDQRGEGYDRIVGGRIDIGAHERQTLSVAIDAPASPISSVPDAIAIEFSEPVSGFDLEALTLSRNDGNNNLNLIDSKHVSLSTADNQSFLLHGLSQFGDMPGHFTLKLDAAETTIRTAGSGLHLDSGASVSWALRSTKNIVVNTILDERDGRIDDGDVSLRDAIDFASTAETILFDPALDGETIPLQLGQLELTRSITIDASDLPSGITIDAAGNDQTQGIEDGKGSRVFRIDDENTVADNPVILRGLTLRGGDVDGDGGAILSAESLHIDRSKVLQNSGKRSPEGSGFARTAAIWAHADVTLVDSLVSNNSGGIDAGGDVTVVASSVVDNIGHPVFGTISGVGDVSILGSTVSSNRATGVSSASSVYVETSTIAENVGRGITANGDIHIRSSTLSANIGPQPWQIFGRIADVWAFADVKIEFSTVSGLLHASQIVELSNAIVDEISGDEIQRLDVSHSLIGYLSNDLLESVQFAEAPVGSPDEDGNLIGGPNHGPIDLRLAPLANNGGPTRTHALLPDSPAIDMGDPLAAIGAENFSVFDQRGGPFSRVIGGSIDIGSYERGIAGDTNGDGRVDFVDFLVLSRNFGGGQSWTEGNFDGSEDGTQFADFLALSANFGAGVLRQSSVLVEQSVFRIPT